MKYVFMYQGLGDFIDCNGMIRYFQHLYGEIGLFVKTRNVKLISYMYRDNPNIHIIEIPGINEVEEVHNYLNTQNTNFSEIINIGHGLDVSHMMHSSGKNCWEIFYELAKVPYNIRYKMFYLERDLNEEDRIVNKLTNGEEYIFVHDDPSRGFVIDNEMLSKVTDISKIRIIKNDITENPFHFISLFQKAKEIHCMESSLKSIIDSYDMGNKPLYFHRSLRKAPIGDKTLNKWITIER